MRQQRTGSRVWSFKDQDNRSSIYSLTGPWVKAADLISLPCRYSFGISYYVR
ncbi:hypothetical protein EDC56_0248 [Sinobacterium caligoides]|uniref:Uncharacterized protein n=1 Tax=Sinobacterium caligoides TaxID=933926 RepID=A0A3N2DZK0_9GAMM|nr:hypothetical protein EDC56_0248 [Sinobacterium caligoides]